VCACEFDLAAAISTKEQSISNYYQNKLMFLRSLIGAMTFLNGTKGEQSLGEGERLGRLQCEVQR
jgi:hypothetical protein